MLTVAAVIVVAILIGAFFQRITGLGVGLVGGPVLSILLGPVAGITMVNGLSIINAVNNAWAVRRQTDWRKFRLISGALVAGSLPAVAVIFFLEGPWLLIAIGVFVLVALGISLFPADKFNVSPDAKGPLLAFGAVGGFMSTIAGIAGPSLTVYSRITGWDYREFVATLHPVLVVANTVSFLLKLVLLGGVDFTGTPLWLLVLAVAMLFVGAWLGDRVSARISTSMARSLATALAAAGAGAVLIRGLMQLA